MLSVRIISGAIGIIILAGFIFWGQLPFFILMTALIILGVREYNKLSPEELKINYFLLIILSLIIITYSFFFYTGEILFPMGLIFFISLFILFVYHLQQGRLEKIIQSMGVGLLAIFYIGGGFTFFVLLRSLNYPGLGELVPLWLALVTTWSTDTGAYFTGKYLGRHQLAPNISPNKTIEGAIGGVVSSVIVTWIYINYFTAFSPVWLFYGICAGILAIAGDLFESSLKRGAGIKDSGALIPGHGGILDRFDSLLFTVPFTYYFLTLLN